MKRIFESDLTVSKIILFLVIASLTMIYIVNHYGGYLKDTITKNTCPLIGEEYEKGPKKGSGKCIIPAGIFEC